MVIGSINTTMICELKSIIQDFLIEGKNMAKVSVLGDKEEIVMAPSCFDIYFLDMDLFSEEDIVPFSKQIKQIDNNAHLIYMSDKSEMARLSAKAKADYFITIPFDKEEIFEILNEIKKEVREDSVIIKVPGGERRIRTNHLNYIDIVKRCLCYHLKDGTMFDGQTLRSSFEKAIDPLHKNRQFYFLAPSLLLNLNEIKTILSDKIIFENDAVVYIPKKSRDTIYEAWEKYNKID